MTFLNSALLAGLLLAGLPILIHLLGRRRLKRQPFPTLDFLRRLQVKRMRKMRIRQWLLLALRTLALLMLALAFLRPALTQSGSAGQRRDTVLLLDLSASMKAARPGGSPLSKARKLLEGVAMANGPNGRLAIVVADESGRRDIAWMEGDQTDPRWIDQLETDGRTASITEGLQRAGRLLQETAAPNKELIWISDFCDPLPDTLPPLPDEVSVLSAPAATKKAVNLFVQSVTPVYAEGAQGRSVDLEVTLASSAGDAALTIPVSLSLNRRKLAEATVTVPGEGVITHRFTVLAEETGALPGEVDLDVDDALPLDNRLSFVLHAPGPREVLLFGADRDALRFFALALDPEGRQARFVPDLHTGSLQNVTLDNYDAVILAGAPTFSTAESKVLKQYLENGGGVWILPGDKADLAGYNRGLLETLGFGPMMALEEAATSAWSNLDTDHPALHGLITGRGRYDAPTVRRFARLVTREGDRTLVRLGSGAPFLVERSVGEGRAWLSAGAADTSWTDWPMSGVFAPLAQQGVYYLASGEGRIRPLVECGEPLVWDLPRQAASGPFEVLAPHGNRLAAEPGFYEDREVLLTHETHWPGIYRLMNGDEELDINAVRVADKEGAVRIQADSYSSLAQATLHPGSPEEIAQELGEARHGREISWLPLLIALLALVAETLVARERKPVDDSDHGLQPETQT